MQGLALGLVLVDRVDDGALERLRGVARSVLQTIQLPSLTAANALRTLILGVSIFSPAISFARSALVEKARAAVERAAVANGRLTASLIAIVYVFGRAELRGAAGRGGQWGGEGVYDTDVLQARLPTPADPRRGLPSGQSLAGAPASSALPHRPPNIVHLFP
jgi:hypothetical protein